ncbi:hypothetical protein GCM10028784_16930 [Myceligenerans cantabricum]
MTSPVKHPARWVVVDTNAFGGGRLQLDQVEGLAKELAPVDAEVVIPEVVVWEWAEHACRDLKELGQTADQLGKRVRRAGLVSLHPAAKQPAPMAPAVQVVVDEMLVALSKLQNVRVLQTSAQGALAGLRAQVLQTGAGSRKPASVGTKTGAADTAWVYDAFDLAGNDPERLVFFSADKDVAAACADRGVTAPRIYSRRVDLITAQRQLKVEHQRDTARQIVRSLLDSLPSDSRIDFPVAGIDLSELGDGLVTTAKDVFVWETTLTRLIGIAGVGDTSTDGEIATATLTLVGDVDLTVSTGPLDTVRELVGAQYENVVFDVPVTVALDTQGRVDGISTAGRATGLQFSDRGYPNVSSARTDLIEAFGAFPTLPDAGWWDELFTTGHGQTEVDGIRASQDQGARTAGARWEASILVGETHVLTILIGPSEDPPDGAAARHVHVIGRVEPRDEHASVEPEHLPGVPAIVALTAQLQGRAKS